MTGERFRVGELARAAGVTVRALHHYDSLGLLVPSERTQSRHRLYSAADVERLYRLLALRAVGLPLEEIGPLLDARTHLAETVRRHLDRVEQQLGAVAELKLRLTRLLAALDGDEASTDRFLDVLEAMSMFEKYYTPSSSNSSKSGDGSSATNRSSRSSRSGPTSTPACARCVRPGSLRPTPSRRRSAAAPAS